MVYKTRIIRGFFVPQRPLPKTIFVVDDGPVELIAAEVKIIFPDADVRSFEDGHASLPDIAAGITPDMLFLDATGLSEKPDDGAENAAVIEEALKKASGAQPASIVFYSNVEELAARARDLYVQKRDNTLSPPDTPVVYIEEIRRAGQMLDTAKPLGSDPYEAHTVLRQYLNGTFGYALPITREEMFALMKGRTTINADDLATLVHHGQMSREDAISHLREPFLDYLAHMQPRLVIPDGSDVEAFAAGFLRAAGDPVSGPLLFDKDKLLAETPPSPKPILVVDDVSNEDIAGLFRKVAGLVVMADRTGAHLEVRAKAHGISAVAGQRAQEAGAAHVRLAAQSLTFIRADGAEKIRGAGEHVTLYPAGRSVFPEELKIDHTASQQAPDWLWSAQSWLLDWCEKEGLAFPSFKRNVNILEQMQANYGRGIGLVRTEHLLFDRPASLAAFRSFIGGDASTIASLMDGFIKDYAEVLRPLCFSDNFPVRIRLLDAPPHEFYDDALRGKLKADVGERNMRGVQLAQQKPELYEMQLGAILVAYQSLMTATDESDAAHPPLGPVEIMVPSVRTKEELLFVKDMLARLIDECGLEKKDVRFGCMLETKDALQNIAELAPHCDFFSIGSNDLTEEITGMARDDGMSRHRAALASGRMEDPFVVLRGDVLQALEKAAGEARGVNPAIQIDFCGDHATHLPSLLAMRSLKLDAVSLPPSPYHHMALPYLMRMAVFDMYHASADAPSKQALRPNGPHAAP